MPAPENGIIHEIGYLWVSDKGVLCWESNHRDVFFSRLWKRWVGEMSEELDAALSDKSMVEIKGI